LRELIECRKDRHWRVYDTEQYTVVNGRTKKLHRAVFQKGQNYKNLSTGAWDDFDGRWEYDDTTDPQGNRFGYKVKKSDAQLRIFTQNPNKKWMRIGFAPGVFVQYSLPNVEPSYSENISLFADSWVNADMRLAASPEGVKNDIILKAPGHPANFSFPVSLTGCTAQAEGNALIYYRDGVPIGRVPAPWMEDVDGDRGEVALGYDGQSIIFTPDAEWLARAKYPVIVDPTTELQPADSDADGIDTYIREAQANTESSTSTSLAVQNNSGSKYYTLILPPIPAEVTASNIVSAIAQITTDYVQTVPTSVSGVEITSIWAETVTWNTKPTTGSQVIASTSITLTADTPIGFDFTSYVQNPTGYGFQLSTPDSSLILFHSSARGTVSLRPKYIYEYTEGSTGTPVTLTADAFRQVVKNVQASADAERPVVVSVQGLSDTLRTITKTSQVQADTKRQTVVTAQTTADTKRRITVMAQVLADTYRKVAVSVQSRADTMRQKLIIIQSSVDALRRVTVMAQGLYDTLRQVAAHVMKYAPDYRWVELPERYASKELPERYKATEIPPRYTWKGLK